MLHREVFDKQLLPTGVNEHVHDVIHRLLLHACIKPMKLQPGVHHLSLRLVNLFICASDGRADEQLLDYKMSMMDKSRAPYDNPKGWHADCARFTI